MAIVTNVFRKKDFTWRDLIQTGITTLLLLSGGLAFFKKPSASSPAEQLKAFLKDFGDMELFILGGGLAYLIYDQFLKSKIKENPTAASRKSRRSPDRFYHMNNGRRDRNCRRECKIYKFYSN